MQMASKYILIQTKTRINKENIEQTRRALPVLEHLWKQNPQTTTQLYQQPDIYEKCTMKTLQEMINLLIDNKLIRQKVIENSQTQYYPAISKKSYEVIVSESEARGSDESNGKIIEAQPAYLPQK
jgi:predicted transcriptional regulator